MEFSHIPVMPSEVISSLDIKSGGTYIDCTVGGGGHSFLIASFLDAEKGGRLIGIDQDENALEAASEHLKEYADIVTLVRANFSELDRVASDLGITEIDGLLIDLGVSSHQLDTPERGFSYMHDAPLDMRMDRRTALSAYNVVNEWSEQELSRIIFEYGEDRFARKIAAEIVKRRAVAPIATTGELADICKSAVPPKVAAIGGNPAKKTFQAVRIAVNRELDVIEPTLEAAVRLMKQGGRLSVITFHSLEDRIVKSYFSTLLGGCTCPHDFPVCVCGNKPTVRLVSKKPIVPSEEELLLNKRSHSAKLRVCEKL